MKHNVTPLNGQNELLALAKLMFGNYFLETQLGCYLAQSSPTPPDTQLGLLPCRTGENETCTGLCNSSSSSVSSTSAASGPCTNDLWILYFDGSKTQDGFGAGCVLIDPRKRKHLVSSRLEFKCTNNIANYEALLLGLHKALNLNVAMLKVVGDSKIVVRQVRNTIHYVSPHLKSYQQEVWPLISNFQALSIIFVP